MIAEVEGGQTAVNVINRPACHGRGTSPGSRGAQALPEFSSSDSNEILAPGAGGTEGGNSGCRGPSLVTCCGCWSELIFQ